METCGCTAWRSRSQSPAQRPASSWRHPGALRVSPAQAPLVPNDVVLLSASTKRRLRDLLEREHRTHNTYRYHSDELAAVRDIVYELEVRCGAKVTKNDVMRAAVLWAIEDCNERGERSLLVQLLGEGD